MTGVQTCALPICVRHQEKSRPMTVLGGVPAWVPVPAWDCVAVCAATCAQAFVSESFSNFYSSTALGITELQCTGCFSCPHSDRHRNRQKLRWAWEAAQPGYYSNCQWPVLSYEKVWPKEHKNSIILVTIHSRIPIDWLWAQSRNDIKSKILSCYAIRKTNNLSFYYCNLL